MSQIKKKVFLTGTTGSMGGAALRELLTRGDRFSITTLVRPSAKNKEAMAEYANNPHLNIVWGDLTKYDDVLKCVTGSDYVLHPAALISPEADHKPDQAWKINVGSAEHIVNAIKAQTNPDAIKLVTIGTVAATGDRLPPIHWGRTGDPLKPSIYDMYACSKIAAERVVAESGLKYWVSCRQTFIAIPDQKSLLDPIMFHQPINTCIEFCTLHDAGRLLANACEDFVPEEFWRRFYNIGGGEECRVTYLDFLDRSFTTMGMANYRKIVERNWFALRNFHCQWYEDSDVLEGYLKFRSESFDDLLVQVKQAMPWYDRVGARFAPSAVIKNFALGPLANKSPDCTMYWMKHNKEMRISAFFKSKAEWQKIPTWDVDMPEDPWKIAGIRLDHGYDENKDLALLNLQDMQGVAAFRGGVCHANTMNSGDLFTPLAWQCAFGHQFNASPNLVLKGGHWCPDCSPPGWNFDEQAKHNPFFAQVWYNNHDKTENNVYPKDCYKDLAQ